MKINDRKYTDDDKMLAKQADLIAYLKEFHPDTIKFAAHPGAKKHPLPCYRSTEHDSIAFYTRDEGNGITISRYHRFSTNEDDDGIEYLRKYLGYTFTAAMDALMNYAERPSAA